MTFPVDMGWSDLGTPERMAEWMAFQRGAKGVPATSDGRLEQSA